MTSSLPVPPSRLISSSRLVLIQEATEIEREAAREAGAIGYMARLLVQVTMPHSRPDTDRYVRSNGGFTIQSNRSGHSMAKQGDSVMASRSEHSGTCVLVTRLPTMKMGSNAAPVVPPLP